MNILVSPLSQTPIYEQIKNQIRELVLTGKLKSDEQLPSIRLMAKDLRIGIITVKRAYDDLSAEGIVLSLPGRGVFVAEIDEARAKKIYLDMLKEKIDDLKEFCDGKGLTKQDIKNLIDETYGGKNNAK